MVVGRRLRVCSQSLEERSPDVRVVFGDSMPAWAAYAPTSMDGSLALAMDWAKTWRAQRQGKCRLFFGCMTKHLYPFTSLKVKS